MPQPQTPPIETDEDLRRALEALLFITDRPLSAAALSGLTGIKDQERVAGQIEGIRAELDARASALQVLEVAEGFQMATRPGCAAFVRRLFADKLAMRLSTAALETLSIIAYKQPLTRAEIEQIRGVEVIAALETLLEKRLVRVVGRRETVGRPLMYGTTPEFLRHFGLRSVEDLPPLESLSAEPVEAAAPEGAPLARGQDTVEELQAAAEEQLRDAAQAPSQDEGAPAGPEAAEAPSEDGPEEPSSPEPAAQ